jgi:4-hydroxy-2-oxoglutarate aldolase
VESGPARESRIDGDANAALGRGIVEPVRHQKKSLSDRKRLPPRARVGDPIAIILWLDAWRICCEAICERGRIDPVGKKCRQARASVRKHLLDDAFRSELPQVGDEKILLLITHYQFQRKHQAPFATVVLRMKLQGIYVDTTTPFDHNGDLYRVKIQHNIEKWSRTTVSGYVVGGWAGESAHLSAEDRRELWTVAAKSAAPGKTLIAGIDRHGVREASLLAGSAAEAGFDAVLASGPANPSVAVLFLQSLADRSPVPVIVSDHTGLPVETVALLANHPNIAGVLESGGNRGKIRELVSAVPRDFAVLTGSDQTVWEALMAGASGAILAFASAAPYAAIALWEAFRTREEAAGLDWQARIACAANAGTGKFGIAGLKSAMDVNGYYGGPPRLPLTVLTPAENREVESAMRDLKS